MAKTQQENEGHLREYRDDIRQAVEVMNKGASFSTPPTPFGALVAMPQTPRL